MGRPLRLVKDRLSMAFAELETLGYFTKHDFEDCRSCAWSVVPEMNQDKAIFYTQQDTETMDATGCVYLSWSGDGDEIVRILKKNGLRVDWNKSQDSRLLVSFNMKWEPA